MFFYFSFIIIEFMMSVRSTEQSVDSMAGAFDRNIIKNRKIKQCLTLRKRGTIDSACTTLL